MKIKTQVKVGQSTSGILDWGRYRPARGFVGPEPRTRFQSRSRRDGDFAMKIKAQIKAGQSTTTILDWAQRPIPGHVGPGRARILVPYHPESEAERWRWRRRSRPGRAPQPSSTDAEETCAAKPQASIPRSTIMKLKTSIKAGSSVPPPPRPNWVARGPGITVVEAGLLDRNRERWSAGISSPPTPISSAREVGLPSLPLPSTSERKKSMRVKSQVKAGQSNTSILD